MRILVIEDSRRLRETLVDGLRSAGFAVDAVEDGRQGLIHARTSEYDLIILDILLPELDGLTLLRRYRESKGSAPVLILSARDRVEHRVEGLRDGADDYLVKPFSFEELLARIEALTRRSHGIVDNVVSINGVSLNLAAKQFTVRGTPVDMTPREYSVLECLFLRCGQTVSRAQLEEHVYASDKQIWSNSMDSAVAAIRKKIAEAGVEDLITTRRGLGYMVSGERTASRDDE